MDGILKFLAENWRNGLEIIILAVGIYYAYLNLRNMRGARALIAACCALMLITLISRWAELPVMEYLLRSASFFLAVAAVIIFQPELRRAMNDLANWRFFAQTSETKETAQKLIDISRALADRRFGALIAIERDMELNSIAESGVLIDSEMSVELALTIFFPKTALHDGGMIVRNDRFLAAATIFPVTDKEFSDRSIGLRHRAAMGLSEQFDAVIIAVSEETGQISLFHGGKMERALSRDDFKRRLNELLISGDGGGLANSGKQLEDKTGVSARRDGPVAAP
jgi:diadenylate cyclase